MTWAFSPARLDGLFCLTILIFLSASPINQMFATMDGANHHDALSSAWTETAAAIELIQMKNQQPTNLECRAASKLLAGMMHTNESSVASPVHHHANEEEGATGTSPAAVIPFNNYLSTLPFAIADMSRDDQFLSPLQVYLRRHCTEYFSATAENAFARGRQSSVEAGRVGVRCVFCKHLPREQQASQASECINSFDLHRLSSVCKLQVVIRACLMLFMFITHPSTLPQLLIPTKLTRSVPPW